MSALDFDLIQALRVIEDDPVAKQTFWALIRRLGQSGWSLAKSVDEDPHKVADALRHLTNIGVLKSTDPGLEGNYSLTDLGFGLKEQIARRNS